MLSQCLHQWGWVGMSLVGGVIKLKRLIVCLWPHQQKWSSKVFPRPIFTLFNYTIDFNKVALNSISCMISGKFWVAMKSSYM